MSGNAALVFGNKKDKEYKEKVIVVGVSVGCLAAAVRLLSRGYDVKIYEKENTVGGYDYISKHIENEDYENI